MATLATSGHAAAIWAGGAGGAGVALWGLHMAMTQGLLAAMVAGTAPANLRGTAFGFFNLPSGLALLVASTVAGVLWDRFGAAVTFAAGAVFSVLALALIGWWREDVAVPRKPENQV